MDGRSAGGPPPPLSSWPVAGFEVRRFSIPPGGERAYDQEDWRDAIVIVERGSVELEMRGGRRGAFIRGDVLHLSELPVQLLRNRGRVIAVLSAVSRSRPEH